MSALSRLPLLRGSVTVVALLALVSCAGPAQTYPSSADETRLFEETYSAITDYYIERVTPAALAMAGLGRLQAIDAAFTITRADNEVVLRHGSDILRLTTPAADDLNGWAKLTDASIRMARGSSPAIAALTPDGLDQAVIDGSLTVLDRFSHYSPPDVARERRAARDGFGGIGVTLDAEGDGIRIVEVLPESPAAIAGLAIDDRIVAIDGIETAKLPREDVVGRLRGLPESSVSLAVARGGAPAPVVVTMKRARIVPPSVTLREIDGIADLRVSSFNQHTAQAVVDLLKRAHRDLDGKLHGVILDLRGNPGGLLDQSVDVAGLFLEGGLVTSTTGRVPESNQSFAAPRRAIERLPLVVLVNGGSASASEIVASALQDTGRAVVIGTASYGKGTVQNVQRLPNDGELTITWARLITPAGYVLHQHGVVPSVCTASLPDSAEGVADALRQTADGSRSELVRPRPGLDEAAWQKLRELCPGQRDDRTIEVEAARHLLTDPVLYARALVGGATAAGAKSLTTAGVLH